MYRIGFFSVVFFVSHALANPQFLHVGSNISEMNPITPTPLKISAVLTHPKGVENIVGGVLLDPIKGGTYGAFSAEAQEGSYEIDLNWKAINEVSPINAPAGGAKREFILKFFDESGAFSQASISVSFACSDSKFGVCNGLCTELLISENHCGTCGESLVKFKEKIAKATLNNNYIKISAFSTPKCLGGNPSIAMASLLSKPITCRKLCAEVSLKCGKKISHWISHNQIGSLAIGMASYLGAPSFEQGIGDCEETPSPYKPGKLDSIQCGCFQ